MVSAYVAVVGLVTAKVPSARCVLGAATVANVAVPVELKPVPVKVMTDPTAAPAANDLGDAEVMTGPATVKALAEGPLMLAVEVLYTSMLSVPAVAPEATVTALVSVVPAEFTVLENVTSGSTVPAAVRASTELPEPKPEPVIVRVTGVVPVEPTTIGAFGAIEVAVTIGATVEASP